MPPLPGDWWAARTSDGVAVGYGWLDANWGGDAEILLAVDASAQQQGVGSFVIARLEDEAARRGLNYVYNTVRDTHPQRDDLHDWLAVRGYRGSQSGEGDTTLRKRVGDEEAREAASGAARAVRAYDPAPTVTARPATRSPAATSTSTTTATEPEVAAMTRHTLLVLQARQVGLVDGRGGPAPPAGRPREASGPRRRQVAGGPRAGPRPRRRVAGRAGPGHLGPRRRRARRGAGGHGGRPRLRRPARGARWRWWPALPEEASTVLLVGHNPGLEELVEDLTGEPVRMPTVRARGARRALGLVGRGTWLLPAPDQRPPTAVSRAASGRV